MQDIFDKQDEFWKRETQYTSIRFSSVVPYNILIQKL